MKKVGILLLLGIGIFISCSQVPTEELENAKTALERAQSVEASIWAEEEYLAAEKAYITATNCVADKSCNIAKEQALLAITNANMAYDIAVEKRATDMYEKVEFLYESAQTYFADQLMPEKWAQADADFIVLTETYENAEYIEAYEQANTLYDTLSEIVSYAKEEFEKAKNAIEDAQDQYDRAENMDIVIKYTMSNLETAAPLIEEARTLYENGDLEGAVEKANAALDIIDEAVAEAERLYQEELEQQKINVDQIEIEKQQKLEAEKNEAEEYLKKFKNMLDETMEDLEEMDLGYLENSLFDHYASAATDMFFKVNQNAADTNQPKPNTRPSGSADATGSSSETNKPATEGRPSGAADATGSSSETNKPATEGRPSGAADATGSSSETNKPATEGRPSGAADATGSTATTEGGESERGGDVSVSLEEETLKEEDIATTMDAEEETAEETEVEGMISPSSFGDYDDYENIKDEDVTLELVQNLYALAEESYNDADYLMTKYYSELGVRYLDILKARSSEVTYTVVLNVEDRDCLWKIAGRFYDDEYWMWPLIWRANKYLIEDPDLIYPGQEFVIPPSLD